MNIAVLGTGRVGRVIAADLSNSFNVTACDRDAASLEALEGCGEIETRQADLTDPQAIHKLVEPQDLAVCAMPGFLGFQTLQAVIEAGLDVVDISFFPENPAELHELAKTTGVTALVDFGVAPGMSNLVAGYHDARMEVERFDCMVGGLPVRRTWPFEYKAPFSPIDVIEEYKRPARLVIAGEVVTRPALSDPELVDLEPVGTLEAFNTDGLRTLIDTLDIPHMRERTLRYPGHVELMRVLRETGFFSEEPVEVEGTEVRPVDLTTRLLFSDWHLEEGEEEFTIMRIEIDGTEKGHKRRYRYDLYDRYDPVTGFTSMARTTGFACTAAVRMLAEGYFDRDGVYPPEFVGAETACFEYIMEYQEERGVHYRRTVLS
ncbi:MAG: saccharopine dehydrogenase C-terminal domain-containing protein [Balneolaceae bacterium]|nr:saccharopine dehydrogenase C-terminal domain-containing protein [Balneolaceae bacterium]